MKYLLVQQYHRNCKKCLEWEKHESCDETNSWVYEPAEKEHKLMHADEVKTIILANDKPVMFLLNEEMYVKIFNLIFKL